MKNLENLQSEEVPQSEQTVEEIDNSSEQVEDVELAEELAEEIKEVQAELAENVEVLNEHADELEELQSDESLPEKAKNILMAGVKEIKDYVQANPYFNILAATQLAGSVGLGIREDGGGDWKEVAAGVVTAAVGWGIAKAVAYLGWGRRAQQQERAEKNNEAQEAVPVEDGEVAEAQPVEEVEEALPVEDDTENQIKKLKDDLEGKYNDKAE